MGITSIGMEWVAKAIGNDTAGGTAGMRYICIGTSNTAFATTQTALLSDGSPEYQEVDATGTNVSTKWGINDTLQLVVDAFDFLGQSGTKTFYEFGVLNTTGANNVLLCRSVGGGVAVTSSDELKVTVKIEVKQGA